MNEKVLGTEALKELIRLIKDADSTLQTNISNNLENINKNTQNIGLLKNLNTIDKTNLVASLNEVQSATNKNTEDITKANSDVSSILALIGNLKDLTTSDKTVLIKAINEIDANTDTNSQDIIDINNKLNDYALITEAGNKITLECDTTTFKLTAKLFDKNNTLISTSNVIDLPIESLVLSVEYKDTDKTLVITLQNGDTITVALSDLINGLVNQATFDALANRVNTLEPLVENKVDKETGKGLSTNDLTNTLKANYDNAYKQMHTHSNKAILDKTTASYTQEEQNKLSNIEDNANNYILPIATTSSLGGIKIGNYLKIAADGTVSVDLGYIPIKTINKIAPDSTGNINLKVSNFENDSKYITNADLPTKLSDLENDEGFITGYTESDPTVPTHVKGITTEDIQKWNNKSSFSGNYNDLSNKPTKLSQFDNDEGFITDYTETDPTVPAWAKAANKPTYTKAEVGLGNVENKSSATIRSEITSSNITTALGYTPVNSNLVGAKSGIAQLDTNGKVPSAQLPSYVDDVLEYASVSNFPTTGESGKIYIAKDKNITYRWSGTAYVEISASLALGETSSTAYRGDRGKIAYDHSQAAHAPSNAERNIINSISVNGTTVAPDSNRNVAITTPTKTSQLTNDSNFITSSASITGNAATATRATYASGSSTTGKLRNITISTAAPSGGSDGDIWIVYS